MPTCAMCNANEVPNEGENCVNCGPGDSGSDNASEDSASEDSGDSSSEM